MIPGEYKAAIRENRFGWFRISNELLDDALWTADIAALRSHVTIISEAPLDGEITVWHCYSPDFEAQPLGCTPPEYVPWVTGSADGTNSIKFERCRGA